VRAANFWEWLRTFMLTCIDLPPMVRAGHQQSSRWVLDPDVGILDRRAIRAMGQRTGLSRIRGSDGLSRSREVFVSCSMRKSVDGPVGFK
jgi:hypothetical protein